MKMKKVFAVLLMTVIVLTACAACSDPGTVTINVYNWGQYIGKGEEGTIDVIKEFEEKTGIRVNYTTYDSNESMYSKLEIGGSSYDVIFPSDYMVERLIENDMLEEINFDNIPNFQYVDDEFKNPAYDPTNAYSVPYTFGYVGIIYNTKYVTKPVDSWNALWDPDYSGKILMFDNPRDAFGIAQFLLGQDINTEDKSDYYACYQKLSEQKPLVQEYVMDQIFQQMENEEAWIAPYYAGDFLTMKETNENLAFAFPKEGYNYFVDAICIPKGCKNKEAAEAFINFICDPEISGKNCEAIGYSTPISAAKEYYEDTELASNPVAYPSKEVFERADMFTNLKDETLQYANELWLAVKSGTKVEEE